MGRSRYLRAVHPGPVGGLDPEAPEALLECLTEVSERIGRPAVLIAMDDLSAIAVSRVAPRLRERFRIPHQPDNLPPGWPTRPSCRGSARGGTSRTRRP